MLINNLDLFLSPWIRIRRIHIRFGSETLIFIPVIICSDSISVSLHLTDVSELIHLFGFPFLLVVYRYRYILATIMENLRAAFMLEERYLNFIFFDKNCFLKVFVVVISLLSPPP